MMTWWPVRAVRQNVEVWVPAVTVFTPFPAETNLMGSNTAGLASGNNRDEALLHALYEVIEYDCQAFGEVLNMGYRIRPETLPDAARELMERYERASVDVTVHACINGIGIPSFFAMTEDKHALDAMLFNGGCGCHLDPAIGVLRALTEAAQSRLSVIAGAREDMDRQEHRRNASYADLRGKLHRWSDGRPWCSFDEFANQTTGTMESDLNRVLDALSADGLDLVLAAELAPRTCLSRWCKRWSLARRSRTSIPAGRGPGCAERSKRSRARARRPPMRLVMYHGPSLRPADLDDLREYAASRSVSLVLHPPVARHDLLKLLDDKAPGTRVLIVDGEFGRISLYRSPRSGLICEPDTTSPASRRWAPCARSNAARSGCALTDGSLLVTPTAP